MHFPQHEKYMIEALRLARECKDEIPVGCVIVYENEIIAAATNAVRLMGRESAHAELIALDKAAKEKKLHSMEECTLYTTLEPCGMCSGAIANYRVGQVVFGAYDESYGCIFSKINLPRVMGQSIKCIGGVLEDECKELLDSFFQRLRS